jgi:hypothetical protein
MTVGRLILPLTIAVLALSAGDACAQGAFPAPLPGQAAPNGASPFPVYGATPIGGVVMAPSPQAGGPADECMKDFIPLRAEAEKRGKLIKAASERHAPPDEACNLIGNFAQAETKMISYVEARASQCGVLAQVVDQLKDGHINTDALQKKVCAIARQRWPAGSVQERGPVGDFPPW